MSSPNQEKESAQTGAPSSIDGEKNADASDRIEEPQMHLKSAHDPAAPMQSDTKPNVDPSNPTTYVNEKTPYDTSAGIPAATSGLRARNSGASKYENASPSYGSGLATTASAINSTPYSTSGTTGLTGTGTGVGGNESDSNTAFERSRPPSDSKQQSGSVGPHLRQNGGQGSSSTTTAAGNNGDNSDGSNDEFAGMGGTPWSQRSFWYQFRPFRGMYHDVKLRLPYYLSDWTLAFKPNNMYRVVAASIRMYFVK